MNARSALCALLFTACQPVNLQSATRDVAAFRSVTIESAFVATIASGPRSVTITADSSLLTNGIDALVDSDQLLVRVHPGFTTLGPLKVVITNDVIEEVDANGAAQVTVTPPAGSSFSTTLSGASTMTVKDLSRDQFNADVHGGSTLTASGTARAQTVLLSGGATAHLKGLQAQTLQVDASGGSNLDATVSNTLSGTASGGSTLTITGNPTNSVIVSGGSKVTLNAP